MIDGVPCVWERACSKAIQQRCIRKSFNAAAPEVLQQGMHGKRTNEREMREPEPQPDEGKSRSEDVLRGLRESRKTSRSPQGSQSEEQCTIELDDVVHLLSRSRTLAEFHGDRGTSEALQILRETINEKRVMPHAPIQIEEVWASISEEEKDRLRVGFDASRWELVVPFPLAHGAPARVGRLRGYGNAINAEVAATFIEAVMESGVGL